eukprot:gnl/TRDRNA2_/TRDRNA2_55814_c0_seq1.p1 gnl/TRDRNA2_/TRDRNA2_55814_c0~~gnl/TRDRNA2_/TRDRNA2_55814_c0_seq1.p1  ORF type:complete len:524 (+),score=82.10 gnl/TRDRNA2_/TRDRNA2_55814_c0_seq1:217-1788(+)
MFDINTMLHGSSSYFAARNISRCAIACASLGIRQPTIYYCIAAEVCKRVYEFKASDLSGMLLAFALAGIQDKDFLEVVSVELGKRISQCSPSEIGEAVWALAILRFRNDTMVTAVSDVASTLVKDFSSVSLAQVLWALDATGHRSLLSLIHRKAVETFRDAPGRRNFSEFVAAACICGSAPATWVDAMEPTHLRPIVGTLSCIADGEAVPARRLHEMASLACHLGPEHSGRALRSIGVQATSGRAGPSWAAEARDLLAPIFDEDWPIEALPMTDKAERVSLPIVDKDSYSRNMADFGVDNFGKIGGRCLLNQIGIGKAPENWVADAKQYVAAWAEGPGKKLNRGEDWKANTVHRRIYVFCEYHFASTLRPMSPLLEGTSFQLNGLHGDPITNRRPWLCAVPLPISKWVDRNLCAEYQLLSEVCEMINRSGIDMTSPELRHSLFGVVNMYLSEPSCVSCVGSIKQFQTLFPGVDIFLDSSSVVEPLMARTEIDLEARSRNWLPKKEEVASPSEEKAEEWTEKPD